MIFCHDRQWRPAVTVLDGLGNFEAVRTLNPISATERTNDQVIRFLGNTASAGASTRDDLALAFFARTITAITIRCLQFRRLDQAGPSLESARG